MADPTRWLVCLSLGLVVTAGGAGEAEADDYLLAIGGGPAPASNEASLEANIRYLQRLLDEAGFPEERRHLLFADGGDAAYPDLQYLDHDLVVPPLNRSLAAIHETLRELSYRYRASDVPGVAGPATVRQIDRWFDREADQLGDGDRLIVYFTGHGGSGSDEQPRQTTLNLWRNQQLGVRAFAERLDRLDPEVEVVLVMVQCFSGGFADVIFEDADHEADAVSHRRVGFFAAPHDRIATGCTPEIDESTYQDYSTHFFAACFGVDRVGEPVSGADLDGDGVVSLAEAHAYVLLNADTIDIPMTASDAYLRRHSDLPARRDRRLIDPATDFRRLRAAADPHHRAVLDGLSDQLNVDGVYRIQSARRAIERLQGSRADLRRQHREARSAFEEARDRLARDLFRRWPLLEHRWQPHLPEAMQEHGEAILAFIEGHRSHEPMWQAMQKMADLGEQRHELGRRATLYRRLIHTAETVALAANLEHVADEAHREHYQRLRALEDRPLLTSSASGP